MRSAQASELTADELLGHYCRHVYDKPAATKQPRGKLGIDRRTVKAKIQQPELNKEGGR